jgi:plasmid stabilization system protein ParE
MRRYRVIIEESAQADVEDSYAWGLRVWGKRQAQQWARALGEATLKQLATVPTAFPLAPESEEFREEIRQMVVGRYRVLFTLHGKTVHVLHIRGAYIGSMRSQESDSC